ncbi:hypothetical protein [Corallococcus sp. AS-1-12]|uniref:hypothetical protein n=1 Tax=Corallococcus sp. AS-1-12 TaxID=2874598 RepID=UPI001CBB6619|nr:hypothetical protein [Corallococcus sp. AS-1-12]MBZ4335049.1 hypothetical protein [Corallococcus sp. AS-1-12]
MSETQIPTLATELHRELSFVAATIAIPPATHPPRRMRSGRRITAGSMGGNNQVNIATPGATKGANAHRMTAKGTRGPDGVFRSG